MATLAGAGGRVVGRPALAAGRSPEPGAARATQQRAIRQRRVSRIPRLLLLAIALCGLATVGLFQVLQTSHAATIGYELRALEQQRSLLSAEIRLLEADVAMASRSQQVRAEAVVRLGMVSAERVVRIAVGVPAPAVIPLPERYVASVAPDAASDLAWWERLLRVLPGID